MLKTPKCKTPSCTNKAYWNKINKWHYCEDCLQADAYRFMKEYTAKHSEKKPQPKINRETVITSMCYTYRHDYGMNKRADDIGLFGCGMTDYERNALYNQMAQIFDNDIAPVMEFKKKYRK